MNIQIHTLVSFLFSIFHVFYNSGYLCWYWRYRWGFKLMMLTVLHNNCLLLFAKLLRSTPVYAILFRAILFPDLIHRCFDRDRGRLVNGRGRRDGALTVTEVMTDSPVTPTPRYGSTSATFHTTCAGRTWRIFFVRKVGGYLDTMACKSLKSPPLF